MRDCKMVVTDLDRTLLRTDKSLSSYSGKVFNKCKDRGIKVVFATARPKRTIQTYLKQIQADAVIIHNGAAVLHGDNVLSYHGIPPRTAKRILFSVSKIRPGVNLSAEIDDVLYCNFDLTEAAGVPVKTDFHDLPKRPADKIAVRVSGMEDVALLSGLLPKNTYIEMSDPKGVVKLGLIMNRKATKANGIKTLANYFGINLKDVIAFGDDYNDIGMLKACGFGIAMGNALDEVKTVADFVCGTNDSDGAARWLVENVL